MSLGETLDVIADVCVFLLFLEIQHFIYGIRHTTVVVVRPFRMRREWATLDACDFRLPGVCVGSVIEIPPPPHLSAIKEDNCTRRVLVIPHCGRTFA